MGLQCSILEENAEMEAWKITIFLVATFTNNYCIAQYTGTEASSINTTPLLSSASITTGDDSGEDTSIIPCPPDYIGDSHCDDECNNAENNYDGGDCCLDPIDDQYCEKCICHDATIVTTAATDIGTTEETTAAAGTTILNLDICTI